MPRQSDFLHGIVISAACSALPVRKKLPTAYSYNGVVLPKLPEWDRSVYPYAYIGDASSTTHPERYRLFVSPVPFVRDGTSENITTSEVDSVGLNAYIYLKTNLPSYQTNVWGDLNEITYVSAFSWPGFWTNHDILDGNNDVFLAASKPVSVYE